MTAPRWQDVARATGLMGDDGVPRATVFAEMSALAARTGAVNLGQGFPDSDGPAHARAAADAIAAGATSTRPARASPRCGRPSPSTRSASTACDYDPDSQVLVTAGATEAIAATILALCGPGRRGASRFEPFYDSYAACDRAGRRDASPVRRALRPTGSGSTRTSCAAAFTPRTRLILVNSPHNPTGTVLTRDELDRDRRAGRRARRSWSPTRCTSTWSSTVGAARAARDAARHARSGR